MSRNVIVEDRIEAVATTPYTKMVQVARMLLPTISMDAPFPMRPSQPTSSIPSLPRSLEKVKFHGWPKPCVSWINWVKDMKEAHHGAWESAGVHDAILNSLLYIKKDKRLLLWFAEKWSPQTNTFVLPWGETTITLEDMMVLGGFSVLGDPVYRMVESAEDKEVYNKLSKAYMKMVRSPAKRATFTAWMAKFMGRQKAHEHEAFLVLWLSKNVFPSVKGTIQTNTFDLAIHLARGRKFALAPAVLANLYTDLHILRDAVLDLQRGESRLPELYSPMYYVQVWLWERFPRVRTWNMVITPGDKTRLDRWARLNDRSTSYNTIELGTREGHFVWQPYVRDTNHFVLNKIYNENRAFVKIYEDQEVDAFARCLKVAKLVGLDNTQPYFPHRVSRQFGYDQDIPADVLLLDEDNEDSWTDYATLPRNETIYLPSRHTEGYMTARYRDWWEIGPVAPAGPRLPVRPKKRRRMNSRKF